MVQVYIEIRGARENNLKDGSLRLPKRNIIIFTGVSGSGKSSMVFDTIANEAQRLLFENFNKLRMKRLKFSNNNRCASLAIVSNTIEDFPEPDTPVNMIMLRLGSRSETSLRLFSRAPRISIYS